ncbi:protein of unknown function [Rhodoferax sp. OV413]|uniref:sialate O-acetylesterase n=1 Tax=Rhodoferax sp. OV413 TaxID=1855285 RepID=UPI0008842B89|nr:sialate O-acetylesterase [Rhodoferax sp. OV413]SDO76946.1 protein of unknown function [Rhodoferax sp. OV413]
MTVRVTHPFTSTKPDGDDPTQVQPSHWNAEHTVQLQGPALLGRKDGTDAEAQEITVGDGLVLDEDGLRLAPENIFPTVAALQTAKPAATHAGKTGLVGSAAPYKIYTSNGVSWVDWDGNALTSDFGFDIVLAAGQSGMAGREPMDTFADPTDGAVWQYACYPSDTASYQKIGLGADPLKHPDATTAGGRTGPASWFGRAYARQIRPSRRVLIVPVSVGGTSMVAAPPTWGPGSPGGSNYENAIAKANAAIAAALLVFPNSRFVGTIWMQGESDGAGGVTQAAYDAAQRALIAGFRARITGAANSWFIIGSMVPEALTANPSWASIRDAQLAVAASTPGVTYVQGPSGYSSDNLHFDTAPGARIMGVRLASAVPAAIANLGNGSIVIVAPGQVTGLAAGATTATSQALTWNLPATGDAPTDYIVEFKLTSGGSWATFSDGVSITRSATVTVLSASTGYDFRVSASNSAGTGPVSSTVSVTTSAASLPPGQVTGLSLGTATASTQPLSWSAPGSGGAPTDYTVEYKLASSGTWLTFADGVSTTLAATVTGLAASSSYDYRVTPANSGGAGAPSPTATGSTAAASGGSSYTFEADTVDGAPANIAALVGSLVVKNTGATGWSGKYSIGATGSQPVVDVFNMSLFNPTADQTVTWDRKQISGSARDGFLIRPQAGTTVTGYPSALQGYLGMMHATSGQLRLYRVASTGLVLLGSLSLVTGDYEHYRVSAIGNTISLSYSADGVAWTSAVSVTDTNYPTSNAPVQYLSGFGGVANGVYMDNIILS